jgi:hypothetical protein
VNQTWPPVSSQDKWPLLGHITRNDCIDTDDILAKKLSLIGQINKVLYIVFLKLIVKQKPDSSKPSAQISRALNCGTCLKII